MLLSKLVYLVIKNVKYMSDTNFTYDSFLQGDFNDDVNYANSINNAFTPLNEAIHRLSDSNKIKYKVIELPAANEEGIIDISSIKNIKTIVSIFMLCDGNYEVVPYREFGLNSIFLPNNRKTKLFMQYKEDIPHFTNTDYEYKKINETTLTKINDVELKEYGLNETMCSYIIEYCQGKLQETIAPELANMHITRAEQYIADLDEQQTQLIQQSVVNVFRM